MKPFGGIPPTDSDESAKIAGKLKECRHRKGFSYAELSQKSGINIKEIKSVEKGNNAITMLTYLKLATALDVRLSEIIGEIEHKHS